MNMIIFGHISSFVTIANTWRHRLKVRTQDFHSCNMGSIPIDATNNHKFNSIKCTRGGISTPLEL